MFSHSDVAVAVSDTAKGAERSFGRSVTARTMHSVAWRAFGLRGDQVEALNGHKAMALLGAGGWLTRQESELTEMGQARLVARAVAVFCQSSDPSPGPDAVERVLDDLVYRRPVGAPGNGLEAADHSWQMRRRDAIGRMLLLAPITHIQTLARATSTSRNTAPEGMNKYMSARRHVLSWASRDQFKARLSIIHASALFWHVRRYSVDVPIEPFGIYLATLVMWIVWWFATAR